MNGGKFKETKRTLKVKLEVAPGAKDTVLVECASFTIELPLVRDLAPKVVVKELELRIPVQGGSLEKKYDLLGSGNGEDLTVFAHDDGDDLDFIWIKKHPQFKEGDENGILIFSHKGGVSQETSFEIKLRIRDHLKQQSEVVTIKCIIVADNTQSKPIWSLINPNGEIVWEGDYSEGEPIVIKPFKAINPANNRVCDIELLRPIQGNYKIDSESFIWTPSYDIVPDRYGQDKMEVRIQFRAKNIANITSECTLVIKIGNSTKPSDQEKYDLALKNFKKSESSFIEVIRKPLCYIRYASTRLAKKSKDIEAAKDFYVNTEAIVTTAASAYPAAAAVYQALGGLLTSLGSRNTGKTEKVTEKVIQLQKEIRDYKELTEEFEKLRSNLKDFKTEIQVKDLLSLSVKIAKEIEKIKASVSNYITIGSIFSTSVEERMKENCGSP